MSLTTDLVGGLYGPTPEEQKALGDIARVRAYLEGLKEIEEMKLNALRPGPGRMFRSSLADKGGGGGGVVAPTVERVAFDKAAVAGAGLGAPSSYAGGAGAPQPIEVIRGRTMTYAPANAGGAEFLTPQMAQQAYNRAMGVGQYVSPEAEKTRLAAETPEGQLKAAQAEMYRRALQEQIGQENRATFEASIRNLLPKMYDDKGKVLPQFQALLNQAAVKAAQNPDEAIKMVTHGYYAHFAPAALEWFGKRGGNVNAIKKFIADSAGNDDAIFGQIKPIVDQFLQATHKSSTAQGVLKDIVAPRIGQPASKMSNVPPYYTQDVERDYQRMLQTETDPALRNLKTMLYAPFLLGERYFQPVALEGSMALNRLIRNIVPYSSKIIDERGFVRPPQINWWKGANWENEE